MLSAAEGLPAVANALQEVTALGLQRLLRPYFDGIRPLVKILEFPDRPPLPPALRLRVRARSVWNAAA